MSKALTPRYMMIEGLSGVATWRNGDDMVVQMLSRDEAENGLPRGYGHDADLPGAFQIHPNAEGDEPFTAKRWKSITLETELKTSMHWKLRVRLMTTGWSPANTEFWEDIEISAGLSKTVIDMSDYVLCNDRGMISSLRFDVFSATPGDKMTIKSIMPTEHDGTSYWESRIDHFGQRSKKDWHGKVFSETDLQADGEAELPAPLAPDSRDKWGGWTKGPQFEPRNCFGVEKDEQGNWWIVTPEGNPYLSLGACCTGVGSVGVEVDGRESWFEQLPPKEGYLNAAWRTDTPGSFAKAELYPRALHGHANPDDPQVTQCNFFIANLIRSFGKDWYDQWCKRTQARLNAWGMTSLGCWSDLEFGEAYQIPTVIPAERISDPGWDDLLALKDPVWPVKRVPDAFDPRFEKIVDGCFSGLEKYRNQPWVLGFFVGNEQHWSFLASPLALPLHWESRRVFIEDLKAKYNTIENLNKAWNTVFPSWAGLAATQQNENPPGLSEKGEADCDAFLEKFCDRYFGLVRKELKRAVPDALFWGCRYLAKQPLASILRGSAKHMDIVSINWYLWHKQEPEDADSFLGRWHELCQGKPLAMTEWSFEVTDERLLASRLLCTTEMERADYSKRYVQSCFKLPFVVGLHWFQWPDQPILGRGKRNGERSAFGIVDVTDRPHAELIEAFTESAREMYQLHQSK